MSYSTVAIGLRAPRVVIVVDGDAHWTYRVRNALYLAGKVWGGVGFAVVPHQNGEVASVLLRACRAYDPDFVVTVPTTQRQVEKLVPGSFQPDDWDELPVSAWARAAGMEQGIDRRLRAKADERARSAVVEACSPYQRNKDLNPWHEVTTLEPGTSELFLAHNLPGTRRSAVLTCPSDWGGLMGVALASRLGMAAPPEPEVEEPTVPDVLLFSISKRWFGEATVSWPRELVSPSSGTAIGLDLRTVPYATADSMTGLGVLHRNEGRGSRTSLVVLGDDPKDFALARLWTLTFGCGIWIPSIFGVERDEPPLVGKSRLIRMVDDLRDEQIATAFTSVSRDFSEIESFVDGLVLQTSDSWQKACRPERLPWRQPVSSHLAVVDQFEEHVAVPTTTDSMGTRSMAAPLPAPVLRDFQPPPIGKLVWHVDISWQASALVRGRGLDGDELCVPDNAQGHALVRSGRNGISYQSRRLDRIQNGVSLINNLARPRLRDLNLDAWISAMARTCGLEARRSEAGQRAVLLERILGNRNAFVNFFGGPLLPALYAMRPTSPLTSKAYPERDGVVLTAAEGVLNFKGFRNHLAMQDHIEVRALLDVALQTGALRRGMVLGCSTCEQKQFQAIGNIGQIW